MTEAVATFSPGSLVHARGREWVVLPESEPDMLVLRPLGGGDEERGLERLHDPALRAERLRSLHEVGLPKKAAPAEGEAAAGEAAEGEAAE